LPSTLTFTAWITKSITNWLQVEISAGLIGFRNCLFCLSATRGSFYFLALAWVAFLFGIMKKNITTNGYSEKR
jgi:hypothetical protein